MVSTEANSRIHTMALKLQRLTRRTFFIVVWIAIVVGTLTILTELNILEDNYTIHHKGTDLHANGIAVLPVFSDDLAVSYKPRLDSKFEVYKKEARQQYNVMISTLKEQLMNYCNPPGPVLGSEVEEPTKYPQFKLKQVQVIVRHGDRSSNMREFATAINPHHFNCELKSQNTPHILRLDRLKDMEKMFQKKRLRSNGKHITEDFFLHESIQCKGGQLTAKGYLQHIYLGEYIYSAYGKKLNVSSGSIGEDEILVFATPSERTHQSAAAFLSGMFDALHQETFPPVSIHVSPDWQGLFQDNENGHVQSCPGLHKVIQRSQKTSHFQGDSPPTESLMAAFSYVFRIPMSKLPPVTMLGDWIATHHCHNHPPICGPNGCIDDKTKAETLMAKDWAFTSKSTTTAAVILSHPLLSKIFKRMLSKVTGKQQTKFVLFSAHDTTVKTVLTSLGVNPKQPVPYASRIVFELWETTGTQLLGNEFEKHFVRVLYNGEDYSKNITICENSLKFGKLCPLKSFVSFLEGGTQSMEEKYFKLCNKIIIS